MNKDPEHIIARSIVAAYMILFACPIFVATVILSYKFWFNNEWNIENIFVYDTIGGILFLAVIISFVFCCFSCIYCSFPPHSFSSSSKHHQVTSYENDVTTTTYTPLYQSEVSICSRCGGSGTVIESVTTYDYYPNYYGEGSGTNLPQPSYSIQTVRCTSCGGTGK